MIRRIILENFMSHEHTELVLADGVNVITGRNNIGKSAVAEALRCITTGGHGSGYVLRHGAKKCRVTIETSEGTSITWTRSSGGAMTYELDGQEFPKSRGEVPAEIEAALRLGRVDVGSAQGAIEVHLAGQKEPLFLLGRSPGEVARFFSTSSDAHYLLQMRKLHQQRIRDAKRDQKREATREAKLATERATLDPLAAVEERRAALHGQRRELGKALDSAARLAETITALREREASIRTMSARRSRLDSLQSQPSLSETLAGRRIQSRLVVVERDLRESRARVQAHAGLAPIPEVAAARPVRQTLRAMARSTALLDAARARRAALGEMEAAPTLDATNSLRRLLASLSRARRTLAIRERQRAAVVVPELPAAPVTASTIRETLRRTAAVGSRLTELYAEREILRAATEAATTELEKFREELDRCPLCDSVLTPGHRHGETAS